MQTGTVVVYLTPNTVSASSTGGQADSGTAVFTLPSYLSAADITGAALKYTKKQSAGGSSSIRFASGTIGIYSDTLMLRRINAGETSVTLRFIYSGGAASGTLRCNWSNIRIELTYSIDESTLKGVINIDDVGSIFYSTTVEDFAKNETCPLTIAITPSVNIQNASLIIATASHKASGDTTVNSLNISAVKNETTFFNVTVNCDDCVFSSNRETAYFAVILMDEDGNEHESDFTVTGITIVNERPAPVIYLVTWTSNCIQNITQVSCTISCSMDSHTSLVGSYVTINGKTYRSSSNVIEIGLIDAYGSVPYAATVTDNHGKSATYSGTLNITAYTPPVLTKLIVERCRYDTETDEYVKDDDGDAAWINLEGAVSNTVNNNQWSIRATFDDGEHVYASDGAIHSGSAGGSFVFDDVVLAYSAGTVQPILASVSWTINIIISDKYKTVTYSFLLGKSGGIFSIEEYGVAVGQKSSGTLLEPKFESDYNAYFYKEANFSNTVRFNRRVYITGGLDVDGGDLSVFGDVYLTLATGLHISGPTNIDGQLSVDGDLSATGSLTVNGKELGDDTGWDASLINIDTTKVDTERSTIRVRKKNGITYIEGGVYLKSTLSSGTNVQQTIGTLDASVCPDSVYHVPIVINDSTRYIVAIITPYGSQTGQGNITLYNKCGNAVGTSIYIPINTSFIAHELTV